METNPIAFKVVREVEGKLVSCVIGIANELRRQYLEDIKPVAYSTEEWTSPTVGEGVFVFDTLDHAMIWIKDTLGGDRKVQIWSCEVVNPKKITHLNTQITKSAILEYWRLFSLEKTYEFAYAPSGTLLAEKCKLIEKL